MILRNCLSAVGYTLIVLSIIKNIHGHNYLNIMVPEDYDKFYPTIAKDDKLPIEITAYIFENFKVNFKESVIIIDAIIVHRWEDDKIIFEEEPFQNGSLLASDSIYKIWTPLLYIEGVLDRKDISYTLGKIKWIIIHPNRTLERAMRGLLTIYCDISYSLYPLDVQHCKFEFSQPIFLIDELALNWYALPKFVSTEGSHSDHGYLQGFYVDIESCPEPLVDINVTPFGKTWVLRSWLCIYNSLAEQFLQFYIPSILLVMINWGGFLVRPLVVPGRVALLLSTLLALVTLFLGQRLNSPGKGTIKALDVWEIACIISMALATFEYFVILYQVRDPIIPEIEINEDDITTTTSTTSSTSQPKPRPTLWQKIKSFVKVDGTRPDGWHNLDRFCLKWFPIIFLIFVVVYWIVCISMYIIAEALFKNTMCEEHTTKK